MPDHRPSCLAGLQPLLPRLHGGLEGAERGVQLARPLAPHLVAAQAGVVLQQPDVLRLALEDRVDPVPLRAGAGELALGRDLDQRVPVPGRVVLRRGARIRRGGRLQVQRRPGLRPLLRRVDQPVPAHPDVVARLRQVGEEVAPLIVGHHDLGELRREVGGLGDHPHARLGAARPRHHPRDVVAIDRRRAGGDRRRPGAIVVPPGARRPPQAAESSMEAPTVATAKNTFVVFMRARWHQDVGKPWQRDDTLLAIMAGMVATTGNLPASADCRR